MSQPYIGQVMIFAFNFAPRDWAFCNGALQAIAQNQALFSIIGTTYGGDGRTTFGLPNIQDRSVVSVGQGSGLSNYSLGETIGIADVTLMSTQMPIHNHTVNTMAATTNNDYALPAAQGDWLGNKDVGGGLLFAAAGDGNTFSAQTISVTGGSLPHMNEQPYLGMNYCIALYGIFPSRN